MTPFRWPGEWKDPALLGLLEGTPVDCIVAGPDTPPALLERARAMRIAVAGTGSFTTRAALDAPPAGPSLALTDGVWPGVPVRRGGGDRAEAGPTGMPWVDSNGWYIRLAQALAPGKTIWMSVEPPADASVVRASSLLLAVADAETYGARWVIALDAGLRKALAARTPAALETWTSISNALRFFEGRRDWAQWEPLAVVAVVSGFSGPDAELSGEVLNLLARRAVSYRILDKRRASGISLAGLKAVIYSDQEPPGADLGAELLSFAREGGLVVAGPTWPYKNEGTPAGADPYRRYELRTLGKGRLAIGKPEAQDPYLIAVDTQLLLSRRHDLVRFFNTGTLNSHYAGASDGRRAVLQVVNYSMRSFGGPVSVAFSKRWRTARIRTLEKPQAALLDLFPTESGGVEVHLPPFPVYAAIELVA